MIASPPPTQSIRELEPLILRETWVEYSDFKSIYVRTLCREILSPSIKAHRKGERMRAVVPLRSLEEVRQSPQGTADNWPTVGDCQAFPGRQLSRAFKGATAGTCQEGLENLTGGMTRGS